MSTSSAVRQTPQISGRPNSRLSAIAAPITSARSHAAIAISHRIQRTMVDRPRVVVAARLRQVAPARDAEAHGERLQQDRHQVGHEDDAEQRVAVPRAAGQVRRPVARVHVADGDEISRARKGKQLPPETRIRRHGDRAVHFAETRSPRGRRHPGSSIRAPTLARILTSQKILRDDSKSQFII